MQDVAHALAQAPLPRLAAQAARAGNWWLWDDLGPQVRQGCPGWLFLADELAPQEDAAQHLQQRGDVVGRLHHALARQGIQLVVAVVPDKSRVLHQQLCGLRRGASVQGRLAAWKALLRDRGVTVMDLEAPLAAMVSSGEPVFFRTDTHWTEDGAQRAAEAVAHTVRATGWAPDPVQEYDVVRTPQALRPGDLVRLAGLDELPRRWQPTAETSRGAQFLLRENPEEEEASLFGDDPLARTVLLGTSFSRTSGFAGFLAQSLRTPLANFGRDGGNFCGGAAAYFQDPAWRQKPPSLVVWEIPERTLQSPVQDAERAQWRALPGN